MTKRGTMKDMTERENMSSSGLQAQDASRPGLGDDHPLNDIIGTHEGPVWDGILKNIKRNRKRTDKDYTKDIE